MSAETGGGGNFVANGPHPINKSKAGGKKQKNESQRQRINRHNNAVGMKVFLSYWMINLCVFFLFFRGYLFTFL